MPYSNVEAKQISELCTVIDCEHKTAPYVEESEYLVIRTSNVRNGQLLMDDMKFTTSDGYREWTQRAEPKYGDVLFTREAPAGESCLVPDNKKVCMGQRMVMLRPKKDITDPLFLSLILNTSRVKADIYRLSIGSTVSRINISDIKRLKVASPPLPEQRKIAAILSTWDKAITTTEQLLANSQQKKKALMQQLLTGKKRLLDENGERFRGGWRKVKLSKLCSIKTGKKDVNEGNPSGSFPFFTCANEHTYSDSYSYDCEALLIAGNGMLGKTHYYNGKFEAYQRTYILSQFSDILRVPYLHQYILFWLARDIEREKQHGAMPYIKLGLLQDFTVLMPTIEEQQKIAVVLTTADQEIETLQGKLEALKQEKKALMQQLLTGKRRVKVDEVAA